MNPSYFDLMKPLVPFLSQQVRQVPILLHSVPKDKVGAKSRCMILVRDRVTSNHSLEANLSFDTFLRCTGAFLHLLST